MHFASLPVIATVLVLAAPSLACVDFGVTVNPFQFASGNLKDNGAQICTVSSYGDNTGWNMNCNSGYSARINYPDMSVAYNTPHASYTFATDCQDQPGPQGDYTTCTASPFC